LIPYPNIFKIGKNVKTIIPLAMIIRIKKINILTQSVKVMVDLSKIFTPIMIPVKRKIVVSHTY
jgi:hypothetical protein